jgi:hypothetical protein
MSCASARSAWCSSRITDDINDNQTMDDEVAA